MSANEVLDVCVVGFGAIGALYAYCLEKTGKIRITAVCRSNYDILREHGLEIDSHRIGCRKGWKPYRLVRTIAEAADRTYAYIICAFKFIPEVVTTPVLLSPLLIKLAGSPQIVRPTTFVLLQNGIGIEDELLISLKGINAPTVVVSGSCWLSVTTIEGGRKIVQHDTEKLVLGCHRPPAGTPCFSDAMAQRALDQLTALLREGGSDVVTTPDTDVERWRKILWNVSLSTLCTLVRSNVGEVMTHDGTRAQVRVLMAEALLVARAWLPRSPAAEEILAEHMIDYILQRTDHKSVFRPSMLVDLECGRPMEVEGIVGGIIRRARTRGVPTPKLDLVYAGLSLLQAKLVAKTYE